MVKCIECKHIKSHSKMTPLGFAHCKKQFDPSVFYSLSYERECVMFEQETTEQIEAKTEYLNKLRGKNETP